MNEMILWSPGMTLDELEKQVVIKAFRHYRQNKTTTANSLGISIRTLENKLEKYESDELIQKERDAKLKQDRAEFLARARGIRPEIVNAPAFDGTEARFRVESTQGIASESVMPVQVRTEAQKVLPTHDAVNRSRKSRRAV